MLLKRSSGFFKQTKRFSYDDDGHLLEVRENSHVWKYDYDSNGNMVKLQFGSNEHQFTYDDWDQLVRYNQAVVAYDSLGRVVRNYKQQQFSYGSGSLLTKVILPRGGERNERTVRYFYDQQDRLVGRKDSGGNMTQYHYALPDRPLLVTHIYSPRKGKLTSLVYDDQDRLVYVKDNQDSYYVVCDQVLAPFLFFNPQGDLVKEVSRSPYGHVTYDSFPGLHVPIGIFGGLEDVDTGMLHIQEQDRRTVYDPFIGAYIVPDWESVGRNLHRPELLLLYRLRNNDPANLPYRRDMGDFARDQETTLDLLTRSFPLFSPHKVTEMVGFPLTPSLPASASSEQSSSLSLVTSSLVGFSQALSHPQSSLGHTPLVPPSAPPQSQLPVVS